MQLFPKVKVLLLGGALLMSSTGPLLVAQNGYYNGMKHGSQGYSDRDDRRYGDHYHHGDSHYQEPPKGGIGPGKGAAIGAAGGAVLGALFGGGLKGAVIGGAAGAGIGAIAGQANQNSKQRDYRDGYR
jgi:hypothetical protein